MFIWECRILLEAELKGSMDTMELKGIEDAKIRCAREHFKAISGENVVYDVVDSYKALLKKVMELRRERFVHGKCGQTISKSGMVTIRCVQ